MSALEMGVGSYTFGRPCADAEVIGPVILSDSEYGAVLGRPPAFPLYLSLSSYPLEARTRGYLPGRVLIVSESGGKGLFRPDIFEAAQTQDVVYAKLFEAYDGPDPVPFTGHWNEVAAVLRDLGPQVRAVMVGNDPYESRFQEMLRAETDECKAESVRRMTEFVKRAGGKLRDLGARPAFGIVAPQVVLHAYWADQHLPDGDPLLPTLKDLGALEIAFCGPSEWWASRDYFQPQRGKQRTYQWYAKNEDLDEWPFQRLRDWVSQVEFWGGVEYLDGLKSGNDERMAFGGLRAGVIGELPDGTR